MSDRVFDLNSASGGIGIRAYGKDMLTISVYDRYQSATLDLFDEDIESLIGALVLWATRQATER